MKLRRASISRSTRLVLRKQLQYSQILSFVDGFHSDKEEPFISYEKENE
jgi:hypothetical protein